MLICLRDVYRPFNMVQSHKIIYFLIILLTLFRGLRWETGGDWITYLDIYENSDFLNAFSYDKYGNGDELLEFGYVLSNAAVNWLLPYTGYLLITNFLLLFIYKKAIFLILPERWVFAFCFIIISVAFFPIRQEFANGIMILSLPFLFKKKYKIFVIIALVAMSIHKSVLFAYIIVLVFYNIRLNSMFLIAIFTSSFISAVGFVQNFVISIKPLILLVNSNFASGIDTYTELLDEDSAHFGILSILMSYTLIVLGCYARNKNKEFQKSKEYNLFLNTFVFFLFCNCFFTNIGLVYFTRLSKYFFFGDIFMYALMLHALSRRKVFVSSVKIRLATISMTLLICALSVNRFWKQCGHYPECYFPYKSVFDSTPRDWTEKEQDFNNFFVDK